jgi:peptide/nickel transport system substrate-binding protein
MTNAGLVTRDTEKYQVIPWMAEELPSLDRGTWILNDDGTMTTIWRLRPNIKWHDGTPFRTTDFVFGWTVAMDPRMQYESRGWNDLMQRFETPDDRTLIIHWQRRFPLADSLFDTVFFPLPTHLLADAFRAGDYEAFNNHRYWTTDHIHLGPYRVESYEQSREVVFAAFDDYFWGRPKIDRVIWRYIGDASTLLSNVLSNEVDVTTRNGLTIETGQIAERQWQNAGQGQVKWAPVNWTWLNPSGTNPYFGWDAPGSSAVRRGLMHAIDRQGLADTLSAAKETVVHFPLAPSRPEFASADQVVTKYAYDPRRAQQLFAEAGWQPGPDGVLVNARRERFSVEFRAQDRSDQVQLQQAIGAQLRDVGVEINYVNLASRQINSTEYRNRWPGLYLGSHNYQIEDWADRYHSKNVPTDDNRFATLNVSRWTNPRKDVLIDAINDELRATERSALIVDFLRLFSEDLPQLPIKYNVETLSYRTTVKNVPIRQESGGENYRTWNVHLWEKTD